MMVKRTKAAENGKTRKVKRQTRRINKKQAQINEHVQVSRELRRLESSNQVYNIIYDDSKVPDDAGGVTTYSADNGSVDIYMRGSSSLSDLAHELKHAYQFDTGNLSFADGGLTGGKL